MKLSVVIVNYNVRYFLEQCLLSVQKALKGIDGDIWVVDNQSVDGSMDMVRAKFPNVHCIENQENVGFSKANNQAIMASSGDYVLLLNPDTVVEEDTFSKCMQFMDEHPEAGALGVRMLDGRGQFLPESKRGLPTPEVALYKMFGLNKLFPRSTKFGRYHLGFLPEMEVHEVEVLAGAFMFLRRSALDKVGLLDETFFMYGEDIDLSYRIIKGGYKNYYFPLTSIIHYKGESTKKGSANYVRIFYQAMVIFARKHYHGTKSGLLIFLINSFIYLRAFGALLYRFFSRSWLVFADAALLLAGMYFLKGYWEEHIKYIKSYPRELMTIHVPYYIAFWVAFTYFSLGYDKPYRLKFVVRGIAIGTIAILAVYGLFPENLRFSRGLIILGSLWAVIEMAMTRLLANYFQTGHFTLEKTEAMQVIIVGSLDECRRIHTLLTKTGTELTLMGYVLTDEKDKDPIVLGHIGQLEEVVRVFKPDEIIFCNQDLPAKTILEWMVRLGPQGVHYKIAPESSSFIIGSNSKNTSGEFFTEAISLRLQTPQSLRKKRWFDVVSSLLILLLSPLWYLFTPRQNDRLRGAWHVLKGSMTWVGYSGTVPPGVLPPLKRGYFTTSDRPGLKQPDLEMTEKLNYRYARYYHVEDDLGILMSRFFSGY